MADRIGPTFGGELEAAGCGTGIAWDPAAGTLTFTWPLDEERRPVVDMAYEARAQAVLVAHDPTARPVPASVTRLQGRLQLSAAGLLPAVEAAIAAAGGTLAIWYADAQTWRRDDPHVLGMAGALNPPLSPAQVDALFTAAAAIV